MLLTFIGSVQMKLIPNEFTNPMPKDYDPWTKAPTKGIIPITFWSAFNTFTKVTLFRNVVRLNIERYNYNCVLTKTKFLITRKQVVIRKIQSS